jgi:hypothetical protein
VLSGTGCTWWGVCRGLLGIKVILRIGPIARCTSNSENDTVVSISLARTISPCIRSFATVWYGQELTPGYGGQVYHKINKYASSLLLERLQYRVANEALL